MPRTTVRSIRANAGSRASVTRGRSRDTSKGQIELRIPPVLWRPGHVGDVQRQVVNRARLRPQVLDDSVPQRRLAGKNRLEAGTSLSRGRQNGERDAVERKHARAATAWLDLVLDRLDDQMDDLQRLARDGSDGVAGGAVESACDRRFQPSSFSKKIHGVSSLHQPALCGGRDDLSSDRRGAGPAVSGVLDDDGEGDSLRGRPVGREADKPCM